MAVITSLSRSWVSSMSPSGTANPLTMAIMATTFQKLGDLTIALRTANRTSFAWS